MKSYCRNCKEFVEVEVSEVTAYKEMRMEFITFKKLIGKCPKCHLELDVAELSDENAKRVLDELEEFNILSPFQD